MLQVEHNILQVEQNILNTISVRHNDILLPTTVKVEGKILVGSLLRQPPGITSV